jgi:hypothetical protein
LAHVEERFGAPSDRNEKPALKSFSELPSENLSPRMSAVSTLAS